MVWIEKNGKYSCELLKGYLVKIVQAYSELMFDDSLQDARNILSAQIIRNGQLQKYLE